MSNFKEFFQKGFENAKGYATSHPEISSLTLLLVLSFIFLFLGLGNYPLIDVDESRYAIIARDMFDVGNINCLMLNGVPFLEKPPMYFWLVGGSYSLFNIFNPFVVRLPIALCAMLLVFSTYFFGKKVVNRKFGLISSIVLLSSIFFLIFSHIAILDLPLTVCIGLTLYLGFLTHVVEEKNKKYVWFLFYVMMGAGILTKGILGFAIPVTIMFVFNLLTKTLKEPFKLVNLIPGFAVMLLIATPWHALMYKIYGYQFWHDYFLAHHFARFINSETIGRERPLLYFVPVFLFGFLPWTFMFIAFLCDGIKKLFARFKNAQGNLLNKLYAIIEVRNNEQKLVLFLSIAFIIIFSVFSISSTKLPTYILPVFPFAALLIGYYLYKSDEEHKNENLLKNLAIAFGTIFAIVAVAAFIVCFFLQAELQVKLAPLKYCVIVGILFASVAMILLAKTKKIMSIFSAHVLFMIVIIVLAVMKIFNFVYSNGQSELVDYSIHSAKYANSQLVTFDFAVKPSVMEHAKKVIFITDPEFDTLDETLEYKDGKTFVIVKNKNFRDDKEYLNKIQKRLNPVIVGERYSLYEN